MVKMQKAYLLKNRGQVVTDKTMVANATDEEFEEVSLAIPMSEIKKWAEEIELIGLDDEEDFDE